MICSWIMSVPEEEQLSFLKLWDDYNRYLLGNCWTNEFTLSTSFYKWLLFSLSPFVQPFLTFFVPKIIFTSCKQGFVWPNRKAKDKMTKTWTEQWILWQHVFNKYFLTFSILRCLSVWCSYFVWCSYLSISCNIDSLVRKEVNNSKLFWIGINWRPYKQ
jgi:hypothetical protein